MLTLKKFIIAIFVFTFCLILYSCESNQYVVNYIDYQFDDKNSVQYVQISDMENVELQDEINVLLRDTLLDPTLDSHFKNTFVEGNSNTMHVTLQDNHYLS